MTHNKRCGKLISLSFCGNSNPTFQQFLFLLCYGLAQIHGGPASRRADDVRRLLGSYTVWLMWVRLGMLVGWASGASSDLGPLLPAICLSSSSGWFRGEAGRISFVAGRLSRFRWYADSPMGFSQRFLGAAARRGCC